MSTNHQGIDNMSIEHQQALSASDKDLSCFLSPMPEPAGSAALDLSQFRLPQSYLASEATEIVESSIPVNKPGPKTYFRAHASWAMAAYALEVDKQLYLLTTSLATDLGEDAKLKIFVPCITRDGDLFVWPLSVPSQNSWIVSAHKALAGARQGWIRVRSSHSLNAYQIVKPQAAWPEPVWPDKTLEEIILAAFADTSITTSDHPVIRTLHGAE